MFTLIPIEYRIKIIRSYRVRLALVCVILLIVSVLLLVGFFLPTYVNVSSEYKALIEQESTVNKSITKKNNDDLSKTIKNLTTNINYINRPDKPSVDEILKVLNYENINVKINKIDYKITTIDAYTIVVSGLASNRKSLSDFAKDLEKESAFKKVDLPISNLAKESDISFIITISGKFGI